MSNYLHVFPSSNTKIKSYLDEASVLDRSGRAPTQQEFDEAVSQVKPYDYKLDDDGSMELRKGPAEDIYTILDSISNKCGAQAVFNDDMKLFVFVPGTTFEAFKKSDLG
ncbi:MAG TPA: hypothetical protein VLA77_04095 [Candidatus Saccharimonadales bacterium]|nr:hypothetical protein [Candidatus Saccharimonadales bacterium]